MTPQDRLIQRTLDGVAAPGASAAAEHLAPARLQALRVLDADLKMHVMPVRVQREDLLQRIVLALPAEAPARQVRIRPVDVLLAVLAATILATVYGMLVAVTHSALAQTVWLTWAIGMSLLAGLALLLMPGLLRTWESELFQRLLGRPIAIGSADVLIYRAVGASLVAGGIWLGF